MNVADVAHLEALVGRARQVVGHFESEGHTPEMDSDCCMCWAVGVLRDALDSYELEHLDGRNGDTGDG